MSRVLRWMDKAKIPENAAILDIGTGNGAFLVEMVRNVYIFSSDYFRGTFEY